MAYCWGSTRLDNNDNNNDSSCSRFCRLSIIGAAGFQILTCSKQAHCPDVLHVLSKVLAEIVARILQPDVLLWDAIMVEAMGKDGSHPDIYE